MAQTTERLTAEFAEKGLKKVRRGLAGLTGDAKVFGDEMETSQKQFTDAVDQMEADTKRLQKVVEAQGKAFEAAMTGSAEQANAVADALAKAQKNAKALDGQGVNVTVQGGGGGGGGASAVGGIANVIAAGAQLATIATAVQNVSSAAQTVNDVSDAIRTANTSLDAFLTGFRQVSSAPNEVADGVEEATEGVQRLGRMASDTNKKLKEMLGRLKGRDATVEPPGPLRSGRGLYDIPADPGRDRRMQDAVRGSQAVDIDFEEMGRSARKASEGVKDAKDQLDSFVEFGKKARKKADSLAESYGGAKGQALRLAKSMRTVKGATMGVVGAVVLLSAKMVQLAFQWDQYAQQLKVAEVQSGVTADALQETFFIAKRLDNTVDFDTVRDGMKELAIRTTEAKEGTGEAKEAFDRLGISMSELEKRGDDMGAVFALVQERMQGMSEQEITTTAEQLFGGEGGERFIRMLNLSTARMKELRAEYEALKLPPRAIDDLDRLQQESTGLGQTWDAIGQKLGGMLADDLADGVELLNKASRAILDVVNAGEELDGWIDTHSGNLSTWQGHVATLSDSGGYFRWVHGLTLATAEYGAELIGVNEALAEQVDTTNDLIKANQTLAQTLLDKQAPDVSGASERLKKTAEAYAKARNNLQDDLRRGLISEEGFDSSLISVLRKRFEDLRSINKAFPKLDLSDQVNAAAEELRRVLERMQVEIPARPDIQFDPEHDDFSVESVDMPDMGTSVLPLLDFSQMGLGQIKTLTPSIKEVDTVLGSLQDQYESATSQAQRQRLQAMIDKVEDYRDSMDGAKQSTKGFGEQMSEAMGQQMGQAMSQIFRAGGQAITTGIFGSSDNTAQLRLQGYRLQEQERQLRQSLGRREITYREFQLRMQVLQMQTAKQQEALAKANGSVSESFKTLGKTAVQALKNMAAEMAATAAKLLVLKGLMSLFNISSGGFGGTFISAMGGGGLLKQTASLSPAKAAGPKAQKASIAVQVNGQFQQEGRGLTATVDASKQYDARIA